jgi:hypothetical protein
MSCPKKRVNGTALITEKPELATALKQVALLHKQFLPYFTRGTHLGESILSEPSSAFVRGYQLGDNVLFIILNDASAAQYVTVQSDLLLWLPLASSWRVKYYDGQGELLDSMERKSARWYGTTRKLEPLELGFFEISTQKNRHGNWKSEIRNPKTEASPIRTYPVSNFRFPVSVSSFQFLRAAGRPMTRIVPAYPLRRR